jgi:hypothetical protein
MLLLSFFYALTTFWITSHIFTLHFFCINKSKLHIIRYEICCFDQFIMYCIQSKLISMWANFYIDFTRNFMNSECGNQILRGPNQKSSTCRLCCEAKKKGKKGVVLSENVWTQCCEPIYIKMFLCWNNAISFSGYFWYQITEPQSFLPFHKICKQ